MIERERKPRWPLSRLTTNDVQLFFATSLAIFPFLLLVFFGHLLILHLQSQHEGPAFLDQTDLAISRLHGSPQEKNAIISRIHARIAIDRSVATFLEKTPRFLFVLAALPYVALVMNVARRHLEQKAKIEPDATNKNDAVNPPRGNFRQD